MTSMSGRRSFRTRRECFSASHTMSARHMNANVRSFSRPAHSEEMGVCYGVQVLWPVLLLQQRMLRLSLAYLDHSAKTQAIAYALEALIEQALQEDFSRQGRDAIALWQRLNPAQPNVFDKLQSRGAIFCSWTKAERGHRVESTLNNAAFINQRQQYPCCLTLFMRFFGLV
jgi:hypothetical protein